ncbi:MAG TPA: hypothetical protein VFE79_05095 [Paraburkholderia sp.]|jgi:hypothetical protein|nr:hypothetical protein [Paraburkholderia sp.]
MRKLQSCAEGAASRRTAQTHHAPFAVTALAARNSGMHSLSGSPITWLITWLTTWLTKWPTKWPTKPQPDR